MNAVAKQWVETLRSGKYKQGHLGLETIDSKTGEHSFCCLGVLCDLAVKAGVITRADGPRTITSEGNLAVHFGRKDRSTAALPPAVQEWAGLATPAGRFDHGAKFDVRGSYSLMALNDTGMSFNDIANVIEAEPEGLFANNSN